VVADQGSSGASSCAVAAHGELTASEARLRAIAEAVPAMVAYWDTELRCRFANQIAVDALFGGRRDHVGRTMAELVAPGLLARSEAAFRSALTGELLQSERAVVGADGREQFMRSAIVPHWVDGAVVGVVAVGIDLTARHQVEKALARSERSFRGMLDAAPAALLTVDSLGAIRHTNPAAEQMFGYPGGGLVGRAVDELVPGARRGDHATLRDGYRAAPSARRMGSGRNVDAVRADGTVFPVEIGLSFYDAEDGPRVIAVVSDITERERLATERAALERKQREAEHLESLGLLAGGVAHDFNNLLTGMLSATALLLERADDAARPLLEVIQTAGERSAELCAQILAYAGRNKLESQRLDLATLVQEAVTLLSPRVGLRARVVTAARPGEAAVEADPVQLRQVVMNLIVNAIEATDDPSRQVDVATGVVELTADELARAALADGAAPGRFQYVEVLDHGAGIAAVDLPRIFDPFFTTKFTGRGLGLAAVRGIVRRHRGALTVDSTVGVGTRIRAYLPALPPITAAPRARPSVTSWPHAGRCLVVDDEPAVRRVAGLVLERLGFSVELASDGDDGVARFTAEPDGFRFVLLDLVMPTLGGVEVFRAIRALRPNVPVVFMSGFHERDLQRELGADQPYVFLAKPFDVARLTDALRRALGEDAQPRP
jgi:two-component system, cell cycle sensor histidine kinase and response regulator CckA